MKDKPSEMKSTKRKKKLNC